MSRQPLDKIMDDGSYSPSGARVRLRDVKDPQVVALGTRSINVPSREGTYGVKPGCVRGVTALAGFP